MQSLEIAVFEAKDPDGFATAQAKLHRQLGDLFEGYVMSIGLRSATEPAVYADLVAWHDHAAAQAAAAAIGEMDELSWFHAELGRIRFFDHLTPADGAAGLEEVVAAPVVELVLVKPAADREAFVSAHAELHDVHLESAESVVSHLRLLPNDNGIAGDVNGWTSPDAMSAMGSEMMQRPELGPVFDRANETVLFMPFTTNVST